MVMKISNTFNFKYTEEGESFSRLLLTYTFLKTVCVTFAADRLIEKNRTSIQSGKIYFRVDVQFVKFPQFT